MWLVGQNPVFLVAHDVFGAQLVVFGLAALLVPAAIAIALDEIVLAAAPRRGKSISAALRGLLLTAVVVPPLLELVPSRVALSVVVWLGMAVLATVAWLRFAWLRSVVRVLVLAPPVFLVWFTFLSPANSLVFQDEAGTVEATGRSDVSVVWLVFDQLPTSLLIDESGAIDADRFPAFVRLGSRSTWYSNASTIASSTASAVPAALTGKIPEPDDLPVVSDAPRNLFTLLGGTHEVHAWETFTQLCPDSVCKNVSSQVPDPPLTYDSLVVVGHQLLGDALGEALLPATGGAWGGFGEPDAVEAVVSDEAETIEEVAARRVRGDDRPQVAAFLESIEGSDRPSVHYLHIEKPHEPLMFLPDGRTYGQCPCYSVDEAGNWPAGSMAVQRLQQYLLQAMYVDEILEKTLDAIDESARADRTLVVVMSDHGVSLLPDTANRALDDQNEHDILPVPVFIGAPGQKSGVVDDRAIQITSILPTVVAHLGVTASGFEFDGVSLTDPNGAIPPLEVLTNDGTTTVELPADPRESRLPAFLAELSPDGEDPYAWGAGAAFMGRDVSDVSAMSDLRMTLDTPRELAAAATELTFPAHVFGEILGAEREVDVVVAIDDVVAGSGTTFFRDQWWVSLMVDSERLHPGQPGLIRVFELTDGRLLEIEIEG